jgi:hypothetical protein
MTVHWPRVLLALLCLLALATSVHAEGGAWIGWLYFTAADGSELQDWFAAESYTTREQCQVAKADAERKGSETLAKLATEMNLQVQLVCLPDTVDPRGPKGK